jgi:uncharacterized delta-60 repeat protein
MRTLLLSMLLFGAVPTADVSAQSCPPGMVSASDPAVRAESGGNGASSLLLRARRAKGGCKPIHAELAPAGATSSRTAPHPARPGDRADDPAIASPYDAATPATEAMALLNNGFGQNGWTIFRASRVNDEVVDMVQLADGRIMTFGAATRGRTDYGISRFNADGTPDASYGRLGMTPIIGFQALDGNITVNSENAPIAILSRPGGDHLFIGHSHVWQPFRRDSLVIYRFLADGTRDTEFGRLGRRTIGLPMSEYGNEFLGASLMADGRIVLLSEEHVFRLTADLTLDTSFGTGGRVPMDAMINAFSHVVNADGSILIGGQAGSLNRPAVAKLRADGAWDTTFGTSGRRAVVPTGMTGEGIVTDFMAVDGGYLVAVVGEKAGEFDRYWGSAVVRIGAGGAIDASYGVNGAASFGENAEVLLGWLTRLPDGGVLVTGSSQEYDPYEGFSVGDLYVGRLDAAGHPVTSFGTGGLARIDPAGQGSFGRGARILADGRIVAFGWATRDAYDARIWSHSALMAALTPQGETATSFGVQGLTLWDVGGQVTVTWAAHVLPDGRILTAGWAGDMGFVARLNSDGTLDPSFGYDGRVPFGQYGGIWRPRQVGVLSNGDVVVGGFQPEYDTALCFVARVPSESRPQHINVQTLYFERHVAFCDDMVVQPGDRVVMVGEGWNGQNWDATVVRVTEDHGWWMPDASFGAGTGQAFVHVEGWDYGFRLLRDPDGKLLVGGSTGWSNNPVTGDMLVARLNENGTPDISFGQNGAARVDAGGQDRVRGLAIDGQGRIVAAGHSRIATNDPWKTVVARLHPNGTVDTSFGYEGIARPTTATEAQGWASWPMDAHVGGDGRPVIAGYTAASAEARYSVIRLTSGGLPDETFGSAGQTVLAAPGSTFDYGYRSALTPTGDLVVAGGAQLGSWTYYAAITRLSSVSATSVDEPAGIMASARLSAFPNPATDGATALLELVEAGDVSLRLFDLLGREVRTLHEGILPTGPHAIGFRTGGLASGLYILSAETSKGRITSRLTIVH